MLSLFNIISKLSFAGTHSIFLHINVVTEILLHSLINSKFCQTHSDFVVTQSCCLWFCIFSFFLLSYCSRYSLRHTEEQKQRCWTPCLSRTLRSKGFTISPASVFILFIWLCRVLVAARGIFSWGVRTLRGSRWDL